MPCLIFDLDDTLMATHDAIRLALARFLADELPGLWESPEALLAAWQKALGDFGVPPGGHSKDYRELKRHRMRLIHRRPELSDAEADARFAVFYTYYRSEFKPFADVLPFLRQQQGRPLGLITNGSSIIQRDKLAAGGIAGFFKTILISDDWNMEKPNPALFHMAARNLGVTPADCLFVGDNVELDFEGSRTAGMQSILISRYGRRLFDKGRQIESLTELAGL
jgi:putative hydrolase of the HAD superfamily